MTIAGGFASASSDINEQGSASLGWEIMPHLAIEGTAFWIDRANDAGAYAATASVQASLFRPSRAVPFVEAGFGLYHASFDLTKGTPPPFYNDRLTRGTDAGSLVTFNDPAFMVGGGGSIFLNRHIAIRPEIAVLLPMDNGHTYTVTTISVRAVYHFEEHPVKASRRAASRP